LNTAKAAASAPRSVPQALSPWWTTFDKIIFYKVHNKEKFMNSPVNTNDMQILTANYAAAWGARLAGVQVISAYPITPQSPVMEKLIEFAQEGEMNAEIVTVESEHSAITVCISASAVGARVFTASCANGLALMHEMLHWAAGTRLPIVMAIPNRAMAAPWSILNDQQDSISQRDTGWMQLYCRNSQEVIDTVIQAYKIAEKVMLPVMVCYDGYVLSHTMMPVAIPDPDKVKAFLPPYVPHTILDPENPRNINPVTLADPRENSEGVLCHGYFEFRYLLQQAHMDAVNAVAETGREFKKVFGREYGIYDTYMTDDAEIIIFSMGSAASEAMDAVDLLREEGIRTGVIHLRLYRPFPSDIIAEAVASTGCRAVAVIEKDLSVGYEGALCSDLKAALYDRGTPMPVHNYIAGLGGRDLNASHIIEAVKSSLKHINTRGSLHKKPLEWQNCRI
jgi:pyruvate/2-oxoacid:ferredoxin oxidoreductase alpha subunit